MAQSLVPGGVTYQQITNRKSSVSNPISTANVAIQRKCFAAWLGLAKSGPKTVPLIASLRGGSGAETRAAFKNSPVSTPL